MSCHCHASQAVYASESLESQEAADAVTLLTVPTLAPLLPHMRTHAAPPPPLPPQYTQVVHPWLARKVLLLSRSLWAQYQYPDSMIIILSTVRAHDRGIHCFCEFPVREIEHHTRVPYYA